MPERRPVSSVQHLNFAWFAMVMGLCGLSLAWMRAVPHWDGAGQISMAVGVLAAGVLLALLLATLWRVLRYPAAVLAGDVSTVVTTATSAGRALELMREGAFDCVVLDLRLPDMSGFDLLAEVQKDPGGREAHGAAGHRVARRREAARRVARGRGASVSRAPAGPPPAPRSR